MNFNEWLNNISIVEQGYTEEDVAKLAWDSCKSEILELLEQNKELESISHNGKKVYKIYGAVIEKIKNEI